jgi:predicted nucleic acid-binding protein
MRAFFDTSILTAALVEEHSAHLRALPWLKMVKDGVATGVISVHSLAEVYCNLTRLPLRPRVSPSMARAVIAANIVGVFEIVCLTDSDYVS